LRSSSLSSQLAQVSELVLFFSPAVPVPQTQTNSQKRKNAALRQKRGGDFAASPQEKKKNLMLFRWGRRLGAAGG